MTCVPIHVVPDLGSPVAFTEKPWPRFLHFSVHNRRRQKHHHHNIADEISQSFSCGEMKQLLSTPFSIYQLSNNMLFQRCTPLLSFHLISVDGHSGQKCTFHSIDTHNCSRMFQLTRGSTTWARKLLERHNFEPREVFGYLPWLFYFNTHKRPVIPRALIIKTWGSGFTRLTYTGTVFFSKAQIKVWSWFTISLHRPWRLSSTVLNRDHPVHHPTLGKEVHHESHWFKISTVYYESIFEQLVSLLRNSPVDQIRIFSREN